MAADHSVTGDTNVEAFVTAVGADIANVQGEHPISWSPRSEHAALDIVFRSLTALSVDELRPAIDGLLQAFAPPSEVDGVTQQPEDKRAEREVHRWLGRVTTVQPSGLSHGERWLRERYDNHQSTSGDPSP